MNASANQVGGHKINDAKRMTDQLADLLVALGEKNLNWGHVGSLGHINDMLTEALRTAKELS